MMDRREAQDLLLDYLYGELEPEKAAELESCLEGDDELRKEYEGMKSVSAIYNDSAPQTFPAGAVAKALEAAKSNTDKTVANKKVISIRRFIYHPTIGAAALLMVVASVMLMLPDKDDAERIITKSIDSADAKATMDMKSPKAAQSPDEERSGLDLDSLAAIQDMSKDGEQEKAVEEIDALREEESIVALKVKKLAKGAKPGAGAAVSDKADKGEALSRERLKAESGLKKSTILAVAGEQEAKEEPAPAEVMKKMRSRPVIVQSNRAAESQTIIAAEEAEAGAAENGLVAGGKNAAPEIFGLDEANADDVEGEELPDKMQNRMIAKREGVKPEPPMTVVAAEDAKQADQPVQMEEQKAAALPKVGREIAGSTKTDAVAGKGGETHREAKKTGYAFDNAKTDGVAEVKALIEKKDYKEALKLIEKLSGDEAFGWQVSGELLKLKETCLAELGMEKELAEVRKKLKALEGPAGEASRKATKNETAAEADQTKGQ